MIFRKGDRFVYIGHGEENIPGRFIGQKGTIIKDEDNYDSYLSTNFDTDGSKFTWAVLRHNAEKIIIDFGLDIIPVPDLQKIIDS